MNQLKINLVSNTISYKAKLPYYCTSKKYIHVSLSLWCHGFIIYWIWSFTNNNIKNEHYKKNNVFLAGFWQWKSVGSKVISIFKNNSKEL